MRQELQFQTEIFHPGSNPHLSKNTKQNKKSFKLKKKEKETKGKHYVRIWQIQRIKSLKRGLPGYFVTAPSSPLSWWYWRARSPPGGQRPWGRGGFFWEPGSPPPPSLEQPSPNLAHPSPNRSARGLPSSLRHTSWQAAALPQLLVVCLSAAGLPIRSQFQGAGGQMAMSPPTSPFTTFLPLIRKGTLPVQPLPGVRSPQRGTLNPAQYRLGLLSIPHLLLLRARRGTTDKMLWFMLKCLEFRHTLEPDGRDG